MPVQGLAKVILVARSLAFSKASTSRLVFIALDLIGALMHTPKLWWDPKRLWGLDQTTRAIHWRVWTMLLGGDFCSVNGSDNTRLLHYAQNKCREDMNDPPLFYIHNWRKIRRNDLIWGRASASVKIEVCLRVNGRRTVKTDWVSASTLDRSLSSCIGVR